MNCSKEVKKLYSVLEKVGASDIKMNLYPNIKRYIYEYLYRWLISKVEK